MRTPVSRILTEDFSSFAKKFQDPESLFMLSMQARDIESASTVFSAPWKDLEALFEKSVIDGDLLIRADLEAWMDKAGEAGERDTWTDPGYGETAPEFSAIFGIKLPYPEAMTLLVAGCAYGRYKSTGVIAKVTLGSLVAFWLNELGELPEELRKLVEKNFPNGIKSFKGQTFKAVYVLQGSTLFIRYDAEIELDPNR